MQQKRKISETRFLLEIIKIVLLILPAIIIKNARKSFKESLLRIKIFVWEEKSTTTLIILITITSITGWFLPEQTINNLVQYPADLFTTRIYTIITAGFIHANIGHLAGNMLALFIFGRIVERTLKTRTLITTYFAALIISGIISSIVNLSIGNNTPGLGASGAIMGIIALAMLLQPLKITYIFIIPLPIAVVGWLYIISDITGLLGPNDGIGHIAHLGGFFSIAIIAYFFSKEKKIRMKKGALICLGTILIMGIIKLLLL